MSGGADEYHVIQNVLTGLDEVGICDDNAVYAICGIYNGDYDKLVEKYKSRKNISLLRNVGNIHEYMCKADIAISAGGSTLYELCACGTPTICYSFADNQLDNVKSFSEDEIMIYAGDVRNLTTIDNMVNEIKILLKDESKRKTVRRKMNALVDGKGIERIVKELQINAEK